jgi:hypothetical protein
MKLIPEVTMHDLNVAQKRYAKFATRFKEFSVALAWFDSPDVPIKGVSHSLSDDGRTETVEFEGVTIAFRLTRQISVEAGGPRIMVVCTLENPLLSDDKPILGKITFNNDGLTDFEAEDMMEVPELEGNAPDIVLHFLKLALSRPAI